MTNDSDPLSFAHGPGPLSRRGLLRVGGLSLSFGAVLAACGSDSGQPGRVGNVPAPTALPEPDLDDRGVPSDAVLLRTATSLEYSAIDLYERLIELGVFEGQTAALVERLVDEHTAHAEGTAALTTEAGGDPYECANSWVTERVTEPLLRRITGDDGEGIEPSDDPARDALTLVHAFESMLSASYQQLVVQLRTPQLRQEAIGYGAIDARHAAAVAIARDGAPNAYVNPELTGGTIDLSATDGVMPLFAVPGRFGSLAPVEFTLGPSNDAGTRFTTNIQTPAANTWVYADQSCEA